MLKPEAKGTDFFTSKGEMTNLIRHTNWDNHPLGPIEDWPESLKASLRLILNSAYPMFIWWGPDFYMFHNDAYLPILGEKHPEALGKVACEGWAEIWEEIGPMADDVMKGKTFYEEDLLLYLERNGFPEETYWTFTYSPIIQMTGEVGGLFCATNEQTNKILRQRRLKTIIDISDINTRDTCIHLLLNHTIEVLKDNPHDIPFAAIYVVDDNGLKADLYANSGFESPHGIFDECIDFEKKSELGWDFRDADTKGDLAFRKNLLKDFDAEFQHMGLEVDQAAIIPIAKAGENKLAGILVCGISSNLHFNKEYLDFLKLIATNISRAKADIRSFEITREHNRVLAEADEAKTIYLQHLKQSQERLETMILQAPVAMTILKGKDFVFEIANKSYLKIIGKTSDQIINKPILEALPEIDGQPVHDILNSVYRNGKTFQALEFPVQIERQGKRETVYFNFVYEPMREMHGKISGIMVVAIDVTQQVKARMLLEERELYFHNMANDVPVMVWMLDARGQCTYLNKQWLNYTGQSEEESLGKGWLEPVHPHDRTSTEKAVEEILKKPKSFEIIYRLRHQNGNYYWHIDAGMPRYDNDGNFEGFTGAVINIHERKLAEDALKQSENELRSAIDASNLGTWIHYTKSGKLEFSERSKELFGLSADAKVDYDIFRQGLHPEDRENTLEALARAVQSQADEPCILEYRTIGLEDGKVRWLKASGQPYFDENGVIEMFIGTLLDNTEMKELVKQKDDFLAIASHELKTPVTSIKGYVQMMAEDFAERQDHEAVNQLRIVDRQVDKLIHLINDLLNVSKIEAGEIQLNKSVFDFDELLKEIVSSMQYVAADHKLQLTGHTGKFIFGDRNRIEQVFVNIISNAIKFSPGAGKIHINHWVENGEVAMSVQDFGVGIEAENIRKIFNRFYRDNKTSGWSTGLGLGLYISSDIIKRHKGSIHVESEVEKGSTFYVAIPFHN